MPEAIAFIATTGVEIAGFEIATSTILAVTVAAAYGSAQQRKARAAYNASLKDRELMIRSAVAPRRIIYGRDKVSGPIVYAEATGDKGQYLHLVIALAAHECDAVEDIYFNDVKLPTLSGGGFVTSGEFARVVTNSHLSPGTVPVGGSITLPEPAVDVLSVSMEGSMGPGGVSSLVSGWAHTAGSAVVTGLPVGEQVNINYTTESNAQPVRIKVHLGGTGQVADPLLVAESAGNWTSAHVGAGVCYLYVRLEYDQEIFGQVGLPNISAVVRGRKVADPRSSTTVWTDNAALCVASWLRDAAYGLGAAAGEVPDAEVIAAANICDETIDLVAGGATTQKRYTYNGSITTDQAPRDALADLLGGMAGNCVWSQGRWLVRAGAYRAPSLTITADHLAGRGVTISPKMTRSELFNAVRVTYRDTTQGWTEVQAPLVTNAMYEAEDGGVRRIRTIQMASAMDHWRAQRLGKIELERGRQALLAQVTTNLRAYDLSPTDTAALTLSRYGFAAKPFSVVERTWSPDGTLAYTLRETAAGVWAWAYGEATTVDLAPDTVLPSPYTPPAALAGLTVESGTVHLLLLGDGTVIARAWVQWTATTDVFVLQGGRIEVQWKRDDADDWQPGPPLPGDAINAYLGPMPETRVVLIRVRGVNASGRSGAWATVSAVIDGKSAPPSNVAGLAYAIKPSQVVLTWTACPDADYAATELRVGASWAAGDLLWKGAGREYQHPRPANGIYTVWAAHLDTSGNYSAAPASLAVTVDNSIDPTASGAQLLQLLATGFAFVFADALATTSASPTITFTAALQGVSGTATFVATARNAAGASLGTITLGGSGNTRTLTAAQFVSLGALTTRYVEVSASITGTSGTLTDYMTVYRGDDGSDAVQGVLSNEAHTLPADSAGTVSSYTGSGTTIKVFEGITDLAYDGVGTSNGTWTVSKAGTGITPGSTTDSGLYATIGDHSAMTTDQASITYTISGKTATGGAFSFTKVQSFAKSRAGTNGSAIAAASNGGNVFISAGAGTTYAPSSIIISRNLLGSLVGGGTTSWSVIQGTFTGSLTIVNSTTGAPASFTPSSMSTDSVTFRCSYTESSVTYTDDITISKSRDGLGVYLTNDAIALPASAAGVISSYANASGTMKVTNGAGDVAGGVAFTIVGFTGFTGTYSAPGTSQDGGNITINASSGAYQVIGDVTSAATVATVTFRATYTDPLGGSKTFDRIFTITKATQGATGATGATGSTGSTGSTGATGKSSGTVYALYTGNPTPGWTSGATLTKSGTTLPATTDSTPNAATSWTATVQTPAAGQAMFVSDYIFDPVANSTAYGTPYLANLKVGTLSAIVAICGELKTATTGPRIVLNEAGTNTIRGYTGAGAGTLRFEADADNGQTKINGASSIFGALYVTQSGNAAAVEGNGSGSGPGVWGYSTSGPGVRASSLRIDQAPATGAAVATFSGVKPGSATTNSWFILNLNGTNYYVPCWA